MTVDPTVHPKDRTTPEEWTVLNLADTWVGFDGRVAAGETSQAANAFITYRALVAAVEQWRTARVYDPERFAGAAQSTPEGT